MSENKITLPTYEEAHKSVIRKESTPLDIFLYNYEPSGESDARIFRQRLENALQYGIDSQESFGLTLDADGTSVADNSTSKNNIFDRPGGDFWDCNNCRTSYIHRSHKKCPACYAPRPF